MSTGNDNPAGCADHGDSIAACGRCPKCRPHLVACVEDAPHCFVLCYFDSADRGDEPQSVAFVRCWEPRGDGNVGAVEAAWATGCNPGGIVLFQQLPHDMVERAGIPMFTLIAQPAASEALLALGVRDLELDGLPLAPGFG